jgi:hypothetical protein
VKAQLTEAFGRLEDDGGYRVPGCRPLRGGELIELCESAHEQQRLLHASQLAMAEMTCMIAKGAAIDRADHQRRGRACARLPARSRDGRWPAGPTMATDALVRQQDVTQAVRFLATQSARGMTHELVITPVGDRWLP